MPIYEYVCRSCAGRFEAMRRVAERLEPLPCPSCGERRTSLALSSPGFVGASSTPAPGGACDARPHGGCCGGACMH